MEGVGGPKTDPQTKTNLQTKFWYCSDNISFVLDLMTKSLDYRVQISFLWSQDRSTNKDQSTNKVWNWKYFSRYCSDNISCFSHIDHFVCAYSPTSTDLWGRGDPRPIHKQRPIHKPSLELVWQLLLEILHRQYFFCYWTTILTTVFIKWVRAFKTNTQIIC